jgi:Cu+-exporting ATPase
VLDRARDAGVAVPQPERFEVLPGRGVTALVEGRAVALGNPRLMAEAGVEGFDAPDTAALLDRIAGQGKSPLCLAVDGAPAAVLAVADTVRPEAPEVVRRLKAMGLRVVMLTGDNRRTALAIGAQVGLDAEDIVAEVLPERKAEEVERLRAAGLSVAMVGDGINDAPALAAADVGMAMGTGIDVAIETGDIVLMHGDLRTVPTALALSRATVRTIKQNLFWAFAFNVLGIPVAAGLLHAFGGPTLSPMLAAAAMAMSSVTVVTNALRLRTFKAA